MPVYFYDTVDNAQVIISPYGDSVGYVPGRIAADRVVRHLNGQQRNYRLVSYTRVHEIHLGNEMVLTTKRMSLNPKEKPLTKSELETFLAHLNHSK